MRRLVASIVIAGVLTGAAPAQEISPVADRLLWCSSAMYWLAADAFDAGEDAEAAEYEGWSDELAARADLMLEADGRTDADITTIRDEYDNRVLAEMGAPAAKYDVTACPDLASQ